MTTENEHPSFTQAREHKGPLAGHFPTNSEEAQNWLPHIRHTALAARVLVVARSRIEFAWKAYIDAVPGISHKSESMEVLRNGNGLQERIARILFPEFEGVPYHN